MTVPGGDRQPGAVLRAAAIVAGLGAVLVSASATAVPLAVCTLGLVCFSVGLTMRSQRLTGIGTAALFLGVVQTGISGVSPGRLLPAVTGVFLAWDFGSGALTAEEELRGGRVERAELLHVGVLVGVGAVSTTVAYAAYRVLVFGSSLVALALLAVAALLLGWRLQGE